jgi:hypothetical protein
MSSSLLFNNDAYVVLETNQPEQLLSPAEMVDKLTTVVDDLGEDLPLDLQKFQNTAERVTYLLDTSCELNLGIGKYLEWYAVRLEKH